MSKQFPGALKDLCAMSEKNLQSLVIEPLLRKKGFRNVHDHSGPNEKGKDLIATKSDEFGRIDLYSIQIKKVQASRKAASTQGISFLLGQLEQALEEPVVDPVTHAQRVPDKCLFITPYPLNMHVLDSALAALKRLEKRGLRIIDGMKLLEEVEANLPAILSHISRDTRYSISLDKSVGLIKESSLAFGLTRDLDLDSIYVDMQLTTSGGLIDILSFPPQKPDAKIFLCGSRDARILEAHFKKWSPTKQAFFSPPRNRSASQNKIERLKRQSKDVSESAIVEADLCPVVSNLQKIIRSNHETIATLLNTTPSSSEKLTRAVKEGISLANDISHFRDFAPIRINWPKFSHFAAASKLPNTLPPFSPKALLKIDAPIFVTGPPGAGKTTMLRRLAQELARERTKQLPLFVPLIKSRGAEEANLIQACMTELTLHGFQGKKREISRTEFLSLLKASRFRLFLDGLDELGSNSKPMLHTIETFSKQYESCPIIVTCRDTFKISWDHALTVTLRPLSDEQIEQFVENWFTAEPTSQQGLLSWLKANPKIKEATRTPIIAGLMCSLYSARAEMPSSEMDLYEKRFELLLGKWDQAKHIPPLPSQMQKAYLHFLMTLAFHMHSKRQRALDHSEVLAIAKMHPAASHLRNPGELIEDCIQRGLLEYETLGGLSFGHLTYQEYLAARWLAQDNNVQFVWSVILSPWWLQTVSFYATIKGDLTRLIKHALKYSTDGDIFDRICHLAKLAPLTTSQTLHQFKTRQRGGINLPPYQGER